MKIKLKGTNEFVIVEMPFFTEQEIIDIIFDIEELNLFNLTDNGLWETDEQGITALSSQFLKTVNENKNFYEMCQLQYNTDFDGKTLLLQTAHILRHEIDYRYNKDQNYLMDLKFIDKFNKTYSQRLELYFNNLPESMLLIIESNVKTLLTDIIKVKQPIQPNYVN